MSQKNQFMKDQDECTVYCRFPLQNNEIDESVVERLFSQFGGFSKLVMKPENNFAFITYSRPTYAIYACELLNGINFMSGRLTVKPRDRTRNAQLFQQSRWSQPGYNNSRPVYYNELRDIHFEDFNPEIFVNKEH